MIKKTNIIILVFILLIFIVLSILIKPLNFKNINISLEEYLSIKEDRVLNEEYQLLYLKYDNIDLILDKNNKTFYFTKYDNLNNDNMEILYDSNISNLSIKINNDKVIIYDSKYYNEYSLVYTYLPIINIVYDGSLKEDDTFMKMYLYDNTNGINIINSDGYIHTRGTASSLYLKQSFRISLVDEKGKNKISLLNMRKDDDWILYSGYNDQEKVRHVFSTNLWYESLAHDNMFKINNGNNYKYVEVLLNNEYWGLYALGYPIDSLQLNNDGYIFKKRYWDFEQNEDKSINLNGYTCISKKCDSFGNDLLKKYYENFFEYQDIKALYNNVDIDSAIDIYIFYNFIQGVDNGTDKLRNTIISFIKKDNNYYALYTPWDLDFTFGNVWSNNGRNNTDIYNYDPSFEIYMEVNPVYKLINNGDENIINLIKEKYIKLRNTYWSDQHISHLIDLYENDIFDSDAFSRDKKRWPDGNYIDEDIKLSKFKSYVLERLSILDEKYIKNI